MPLFKADNHLFRQHLVYIEQNFDTALFFGYSEEVAGIQFYSECRGAMIFSALVFKALETESTTIRIWIMVV
jgi:hypothetical protein